jgi:hypothetical protein
MDGKCPFNEWSIKVEFAKRGKPGDEAKTNQKLF